MTNPLRQNKPPRDEVVFAAKLKPADTNANYNGVFSTFSVRLTHSVLWLSPELAIPVSCITGTELIESRKAFPKRYALAVGYRNPLTLDDEQVRLCDIDFLGFYHLKKLQALQSELRAVLCTPAPATSVRPIPENDVWSRSRELQCERCQATPAWYVTYQYLVGSLVFAYQSEPLRRVHCRRHLLMYGLPYYLITALIGWFGPFIFRYPGAVYRSGMALKPVLGLFAELLAVAPSAVLVALLLLWLY